jgi:hypothetical protein
MEKNEENFSMQPQQHWYLDELTSDSQNIDDLVIEVFKTIPDNAVMKTLGVDRDAKDLINKAIERMFHAIILDHANIFSERIDVLKLSDEKGDLKRKLIEVLGSCREKTHSEKFIEVSKQAFELADAPLELATNGSPKHLSKSIASQVAEEIALAATEIMEYHRSDYLCRIAKGCKRRDETISLMRH